MFLSRSIPDVGFSTYEIGVAIARANSTDQRDILIAMANAVAQFSWAIQCRAIVDDDEGISQDDRIRISVMLGSLIDHLDQPEPKEKTVYE